MAKHKRKQTAQARRKPRRTGDEPPVGMRIVGGHFRGRKLRYGGDRRVRPMKDRVREAVFNLVGPSIKGTHAVDLFAGTGALALEALSRGAARATLIEQHVPTVAIIRQNIATLGVEERCNLVTGNVFSWMRKKPVLGEEPWTVFSSPPYDLYVDRKDDMLRMIGELIDAAPADSVFVVESDERFDLSDLPEPDAWNCRKYFPAFVGLFRKTVQTT
jgi:16S rRNA (guanine966-N2)-methyltransferase